MRSVPTGDHILKLADGHVGEAYVLGARAPMGNGSWRGPWDCAEFASWCVYQASGILFGTQPEDDPVLADAYSGFWGDQAVAAAATVSTEEAARIAGSCLLRKPGSSRIGHIAFSDGTGGTVEAHSTNRGVIRHTISGRRWDFGILVPGISYRMNETVVEIKHPIHLLRLTNPLMRGPQIKEVQRALTNLGFRPGSIDGVYGPQTADAVQAFQLTRGIVPDGEVGDATAALLGINIV